jgi:hypothetical protein
VNFLQIETSATLAPIARANEMSITGTADIRAGRDSPTLPLVDWLARLPRAGVWASLLVERDITSRLPQEPTVIHSSVGTSTDPLLGWRGPADLLDGYEAYDQPDWDGYNADPIAAETLAAARAFLRVVPKQFGEPDCSPGSDGTIGLEWIKTEGPFRKLFIDIGPGRTWRAYWRLTAGETGTSPRKPILLTTRKELTGLFARLGA